MWKRALQVACLASVLGCGGGSLTDLEGIYTISTWTDNRDDCSAEGPSILEARPETHLFLRGESFFGEEFVNVVLCDDLDRCRSDAAETDTLFLGGFIFEEGGDADGWSGFSTVLSGEDCDGYVDETTMTGQIEDSIRIERRQTSVSGVPLDGDGDCDSEAAREQAASQACEELEALTASFLEDL